MCRWSTRRRRAERAASGASVRSTARAARPGVNGRSPQFTHWSRFHRSPHPSIHSERAVEWWMRRTGRWTRRCEARRHRASSAPDTLGNPLDRVRCSANQRIAIGSACRGTLRWRARLEVCESRAGLGHLTTESNNPHGARLKREAARRPPRALQLDEYRAPDTEKASTWRAPKSRAGPGSRTERGSGNTAAGAPRWRM